MERATRAVEEARFPVMGTEAHVVVVAGPSGSCGRSAARLADLERRWSRFRPESELSRLNAGQGRPVVVSPVTFAVIERSVDAWERSGGAFDPTVLPNLVDQGYDRDFPTLDEDRSLVPTPGGAPPLPPGAGVVELDAVVGAVRLPAGTALDLGGIAKGFAADLVATELHAAGAAGACVNIGGDLRAVGASPRGQGWAVEIEREPGTPGAPQREAHTIVLSGGGIATSSSRRRVWRREGEDRHHLIDPRTGRCAVATWASVTAIAGCAADAEPAATAALLSTDVARAALALERFGAFGVAFDHAGRAHELGAVTPFLADVA